MAEQPEKTSILKEFLQHQQRAAEEAGKAIVALIPEPFRAHSTEAVRNSVEGFNLLKDAAKDGVQQGLNRLRTTRNSVEGRKVKIEVSEG